MKPLLIAFAVAALSVSTFGASQAQDTSAPAATPPAAGATGGVREACAADFAKVCAGVDRAGMRQCVMDNFDKLSDGCKSAIMAMRQSAAPAN